MNQSPSKLKLIKLLYHNFYQYFRSNISLLLGLFVMIILVCAIFFGNLFSVFDMRDQINLFKDQYYNTSVNQFQSIEDKKEFLFGSISGQTLKFSSNYNLINKIFPNAESAYYWKENQGFSNKIYSFTSDPNVSSPLDNATFQLWNLSDDQSIIKNYNETHVKQIKVDTNASIYAMALRNDNNTLKLLSDREKDFNFVKLRLPNGPNNAFQNNSCLIFNNFYNFLDNATSLSGENWRYYTSNVNNIKTLNLATYSPEFFYNFTNSINPNLKNFGNQREKYTQLIQNFAKNIANSNVNDYLNVMRQILYSAFVGSITQNVNYFQYYNTADIINSDQIQIEDETQKTISFSPYIKPVKVGFKSDGRTPYQLKDNQVLLSKNASQKNNTFQFFWSVDPTKNVYSVKGISNDLAADNFNSYYLKSYVVWVDEQTFQNIRPNVLGLLGSNYNLEFYTNINNTSTYLNPTFTNDNISSIGNDIGFAFGRFNNSFGSGPSLFYYSFTAGVINERITIITSLVSATSFLLLIAAGILIWIICNKIVSHQRQTIGILKANGLNVLNINFIFTLIFLIIFVLGLFLGLGFAFGFERILNLTYLIGASPFNDNIQIHWITIISGFGGSLAIAICLLFIIISLKTSKSALNLLNDKNKKTLKTLHLGWIKFTKNLSYKNKITLKLVNKNFLKIGLTFLISIITIGALYVNISSWNILYQSSKFSNTFKMNSQIVIYNTSSNNVNNSSFENMLRNTPNSQDIVTLKALQDDQKKLNPNYFDVKFWDEQSDTPNRALIAQFINRIDQTENGAYHSWFQAKQLSEFHNWCTGNTAACQSILTNPESGRSYYDQFLSIYEKYEFLIKALSSGDGIISLGFQIIENTPYEKINQIRYRISGLSISDQNYSQSQKQQIQNNFGYWLGTNDVNSPQIFNNFSTKFKSYSTQATAKNKDQSQLGEFLNPISGDVNSDQIINANTNLERYQLLSQTQKNIIDDFQNSINNYNVLAQNIDYYPNNITRYYTINIIPVLSGLLTSPKVGDTKFDTNKVYINKSSNLNYDSSNIPINDQTNIGQISIFCPVGTIATNRGFSLTNYQSENNFELAYLNNWANSPDQTILSATDLKLNTSLSNALNNQNINRMSSIYTVTDNQSLVSKYLGLREANGVYSYQDYLNQGDSYSIDIRPNILGQSNPLDTINKFDSVRNLIFIVIQIIGVLTAVAIFFQVAVTNRIIFKENLKILLLLKSMGYSTMWVFNRLFTVYVPVIFSGVFVAGPVALGLANFLFGQISKILNFYLVTKFSYINIVYVVIIMFVLFILSFSFSWHRFKKESLGQGFGSLSD